MFFFDSIDNTKKILSNGSQLSNDIKYVLNWYKIDVNTLEEKDEQISKTSVSILRESQL